MKNLVEKTKYFMSKNPNQSQIESFYIKQILPYTKDSIEDLLN
jgi:hypothetical protein